MALIYDDVFAILRDLYRGIPFLGWFLMFLIFISVFLTYVRWTTEQRQTREQWIEEHPDMEELCTFPLCGKSLTGVTDKVVSQMCPDVNYCSKECRRRDANENNHRSMALLIKYRKQELEKKRKFEEIEREKGILQFLSEIIPDPKMISDASSTASSSMSRQVEVEAATMTARRFCEAYVDKFGLAVHHWAYDCFQKSGRGCILIHLSEKAMEKSSGSPLTYINQRILLSLDDYKLNYIVREYVPEREIVFYILQKGIEKSHVAVPFNYTLYVTEKGKGDAAEDHQKVD